MPGGGVMPNGSPPGGIMPMPGGIRPLGGTGIKGGVFGAS